jgi:putative ABC transport system permease protein
MRPRALVRLYRNRLRVHTAQELLAGSGVAVAVALVFATLIASSSVAGSAKEAVHAVVGPASLQLKARDASGVDERLLKRVEHLAGVKQAAPLLEQTATIVAPSGRQATVNVAATNVSLALLNGLAHTLPIVALSPGGIGLSKVSASALGLSNQGPHVLLKLRGGMSKLKVSAVLGSKTFGALSRAMVAVMPLARLQQLAGLKGRISRILVETQSGREGVVRRELLELAHGRLTVAPADEEVALLSQALRPSNQASALFAAISALLGFLFAFNALLLTIPERRQTIADLRIDGTRRTAIVQMVVFQALCLGIVASVVGLLGGYMLSTGVFHQSPGYLSQAFTLGASTVIGIQPLLLAFGGGILATCLASAIPLLDLRRGRALDAVFSEDGEPGNGLDDDTQRHLFIIAVGLLLFATVLFVFVPSAAIIACIALALATVLAVPLVLTSILHIAYALAERYQKVTLLPIALTSLQATTMRSLALAATGAVALFGSVALGGSRDDLLRGISGYTSHYVGGANVWLVNPHDNQAINNFSPDRYAVRVARVPGVVSVHTFQGGFLDLGDRRVWIIAWPPRARLSLLDEQTISGSPSVAVTRIREGGWITVSQQLAAEHHARVGDTLVLPTPTGSTHFRIAATTTNFGWSPGAILINTTDYGHAWGTTDPTALGADLAPGVDYQKAKNAIRRSLGPANGLEVLDAHARETDINSSANEGLGQLRAISVLLVLAAILAMVAALVSSIWQRRVTLAGLRIEGMQRPHLRAVLMIEATLMLSAGCLTGAIAGIYGQAVIDNYLKNITGFPVAGFGTGIRPIEIFLLVVVSVLVVVSIPGWLASRVPPMLALDE